MTVRFLLIPALWLLHSAPTYSALLLSRNSEWKYLKGTAEASDPLEAWRAVNFDDSSWDIGSTPIRYGDGNGGTVLNDMRGNYTTVFMRRTFNVSNISEISTLNLNVDWDDGYSIWINGTLVHSQNPPATHTYDATASRSHESGSFLTYELTNPQSFLLEGRNTIAIQVFNIILNSSDLLMNPELVSIAPDVDPPVVTSITPPPGNVTDLSRIVVEFSELVTGVSASDLTINGRSALAVQASGARYTFTFDSATLGSATVAWNANHGIRDTADPPNPFDQTAPGEVRNYMVVDEIAPVITTILPSPNLTLRELQEVSVTFSETVTGVDAADLLAGGTPANFVKGSGPGPYHFTFDPVPSGALELTWEPGHAIADLAADPNAFAGYSWSYAINPDASDSTVSINEFVTANRSGLTDEDDEKSDWIELINFGDTDVNLEGWSLTDNPDDPGKFVIPDRVIPASGYLVIFASGKNRSPAGAGQIHTNFKLAASGEYLGLYFPELPRTLADEIAPLFPVQRNDYSYGRDARRLWSYFTNPTPGAANGVSVISGILDPPHFNVPRGFYHQPFDLHLTSPDPGASIRYTTDGSEPTSRNGTLYSEPIQVSGTQIIRAAAFGRRILPSETVTHSYFYNLSSAIRSLPVISLATDDSNLWGPTGIQETNPRNTSKRGIAWERPDSAELIKEDNSGFQANCGLRVQGGDYIRGRYSPNGGPPASKYSFRLYFRGDYGPTMLSYPFFEGSEVDLFDRVTLRAGMNDHSNPFIVDEYARRMQIESGNVGARGNFVNLFINGEYKGYYNPTERIDDDFMRSWHGGDNAWDVIAQGGEIREGDSAAWNNLRNVVANRDLSDPSNYQAATEVLDIDNFIDYLLVNVYCGTGDWPHNNWRAARERIPDAKFRFYVWDAEWSLGNLGRSVNGNTLTTELSGGADIARLYQSLVRNPEFRLRWADRFHWLFFNGGPFEDARNIERFEEMRTELSGVLPGMSTSIRNNWIPNRRAIIIEDLKQAGLYRSDNAPLFTQPGGPVSASTPLSMTSPGGTIYYTLDGSDPRSPQNGGGAGLSFTLIDEDNSKRVLVPADDSIGANWTGGNEPFNDGAWTLGSGGVGYDEQTTYDNLIDIDVEDGMNNQNASCYIRIPFTLTASDIENINYLQLLARFDDGFVAYLNGIRITSANAPADLNWESLATGNNPDGVAVDLLSFNVSNFIGELQTGNNILAIHGLNFGVDSSDFLNSVVLESSETTTDLPSPSAFIYEQPFRITQSQHIKARTLQNGEWSALIAETYLSEPDVPTLRFSELMYNPDGASALEFIEIENYGTLPVDLVQMELRGVAFIFPGDSLLAPGARLVLASNDDLDAFVAHYPGTQVFGTFTGSLSNGGEGLTLEDGLGNTIASVRYDDGNGWPPSADGEGHSLVLADPAGDPHDPTSWSASSSVKGSPGQPEPASSLPPILIREVLAHNRNALSHGGEFPDFIELHNPHPAPVTLDGWSLSNDGADLEKFTFPPGTQINGQGHLVVWCSANPNLPGLNSQFSLNSTGETIYLTDTDGGRIDALAFGLQVANLSLNRNASDWFLSNPTPASDNGPAIPLGPQDALTLNEWMTNRIPGTADWLEIYNTNLNNPVPLRNIHVRNGAVTARYGHLSFLGPGSHFRLWADAQGGAGHLDLRLQAEGGSLILIDEKGLEIESVNYSAQAEDVSGGRYPDGSSSIRVFNESASPGTSNYLALNSGLLLNELLAGHPGEGAGWIELRNTLAQPQSLGGHALVIGDRDDPRWAFPDPLEIPGNGYLVISCDPSQPTSDHPANLNTGNLLSPQGSQVYLFNSDGRELDRVFYGAQIAGWTIGRASNSTWQLLASPTAGTVNSGNAALASTSGLRINEWLTNPGKGQEDFVELFNRSGSRPVALAGLGLTDDLSTSGIDQYSIPPLSFIGPEGFVAYLADGEAGPGHLPFRLDSLGETLRLYQSTQPAIIDEVTWGVEESGVSSGRQADGGSTIGSLPFQSAGTSNTENPNSDRDGDEMPDEWEIAKGLDPDSAADATLDLDGDRRSNLYEYRSDTDPGDPTSFLQFSFARHDGAVFTLEFNARPGIRYTIEGSSDLFNWSERGTIESQPNPRVESFSDQHRGQEHYYRLVAERSN